MARPIKWRRIEHLPTVHHFIPSENPQCSNDLPEVKLKIEEMEAIRLKDLEGLEQNECAKRMQVSRPTFQRILLSARAKIADSIVNGKIIHIQGGNFTRNICLVKCLDCNQEWVESYENLGENYVCPYCGSKKIACGKNCNNKSCNRRCHRYGKNFTNESK